MICSLLPSPEMRLKCDILVCKRALETTQVWAGTGVKTPERDPVLFINCFEPSWVNLCPICKTTSTGGKREASGL